MRLVVGLLICWFGLMSAYADDVRLYETDYGWTVGIMPYHVDNAFDYFYVHENDKMLDLSIDKKDYLAAIVFSTMLEVGIHTTISAYKMDCDTGFSYLTHIENYGADGGLLEEIYAKDMDAKLYEAHITHTNSNEEIRQAFRQEVCSY